MRYKRKRELETKSREVRVIFFPIPDLRLSDARTVGRGRRRTSIEPHIGIAPIPLIIGDREQCRREKFDMHTGPFGKNSSSLSERKEWFERASKERILTSKSPLWRDEKLYFTLPHGYSTGRDIKDAAPQASIFTKENR